ncbi:MAG TPA: hypothetical protein VFB50_20135, partial [Chloroflexota bacterium]|nr:hypothetical protein [Chloroflexota bacterium]
LLLGQSRQQPVTPKQRCEVVDRLEGHELTGRTADGSITPGNAAQNCLDCVGAVHARDVGRRELPV